MVSRTIVKSSLVAMTRIRPGEACTGDVRIGLAARVGGGIEFQSQMAEVFADELPDLRGILADAGGEDQSINSSECCGHRSDCLHQPVDIDFQGQASVRTFGGLFQNLAHVRRNPGEAKQAGFVVQRIVELLDSQPLAAAGGRAARPGQDCRCACP